MRNIQGQPDAVCARGQRQGGRALRTLHRDARQEAGLPALPADRRARRHPLHPPQPGPRHAGGTARTHTHTHTLTRTHTRTYTHTHTQIHTYTRTIINKCLDR